MAQKLAALFAAVTLAVMCYSSSQISILHDNVKSLLMEEMITTKTATWWCPTDMTWETVTVSGSNAEKVCEEFRKQKAAAQKECPPGDPPTSR